MGNLPPIAIVGIVVGSVAVTCVACVCFVGHLPKRRVLESYASVSTYDDESAPVP